MDTEKVRKLLENEINQAEILAMGAPTTMAQQYFNGVVDGLKTASLLLKNDTFIVDK